MNDDAIGFSTGWDKGPSAEIDLFGSGKRDSCYVKYTPPFHWTIRPAAEEKRVGPEELGQISQQLEYLVKTLRPRSETADVGTTVSASSKEIDAQMKRVGKQLYTFLLSKHVRNDLSEKGLFLEIGTDERLVHFPWELMFDGDEFLCVKHALGRFIHGRETTQPMQRPSTRVGSKLETLSILIICVPKPEERKDVEYKKLLEAENEMMAIVTSLKAALGDEFEPCVLMHDRARYNDVFDALQERKYQIIHFIGHAHFDDDKPYKSSLVLFDRDMTTGPLSETIRDNPPILCFINGCETAKSVDTTDPKKRLDVYGLARAFLDTGAYLLGSRWRVNDKAAAEFAKSFYASLITGGKSIGWAIVDARKACRKNVLEDPFGWASYIYYGDPRVCLRMP